MVNHGVSRGCRTCRIRRKKCDESRPSCNRCNKIGRPCQGYLDEGDLIFRGFHTHRGPTGQTYHQLTESPSSSQILTLTSSLNSALQTLDDAQLEEYALADFFHNYCIPSANRLLSRGYLDGLESLLDHAGPSSDLSKACKIVALTTLGRRLSRQTLVHKARMLYSSLLRSFHATISDSATSNTVESVITAVLLGVYELITATESHPANHCAHSQGVSAILSSENSPFTLYSGTKLFQIANPLRFERTVELPQTVSILCAPVLNRSVQSLDTILTKIPLLLQRSRSLLPNTSTPLGDLSHLLRDAEMLNEEYAKWPESQPEEWMPRTIGSTVNWPHRSTEGIDLLPRHVDTYLDPCVAGVWNTYRKTRLMVLDIIMSCSMRLGENDRYHETLVEAEDLANSILASAPFYLAENLQIFMQRAESGLERLIPGRSIGGLLLMHPLYVAANLSVVSSQLRTLMREFLEWIGDHMGIGEATVLSKASATFPNKSVANGYVLIWAGMLIQPV